MLIPCQRHLFDIPDDVAYLNCAYMSPLMHEVVAAGQAGVARKARPWTITPADFFSEPEEARALFARLIGGQASCVAIVPAVSYGIAVAAANVPLSRGQRVLVLADQFPSNVFAWREAAKAAGAEVTTVREGNAPLSDRLLEQIDRRTAVVAVPHCRWTDGALLDVVSVGARCREVGAALVLDVTQSAGALPLDVARVDPDFVVAGCYKWLLGPYTLGFLHVAARWHGGTPLEHNWIARAGSEDFSGLVDYQDAFQPGAQRYDVGERSCFHLMPMALAAMRRLLQWGVEPVAETLTARTGDIARRAAALGLRALPETERAGHFLGLRFSGGLPPTLPEALAARRVFVSVRGDAMRVTPHVYNSDDDVERLFEALAAVRR
jgi:selenocysteine lyase/cysteine desulfurase